MRVIILSYYIWKEPEYLFERIVLASAETEGGKKDWINRNYEIPDEWPGVFMIY